MRRAKHVISFDELYDYFLKEDVFRFVRYEETPDVQSIILCNTFKISKVNDFDKFEFHIFKASSIDRGGWVKGGGKLFTQFTSGMKLLFRAKGHEDKGVISYFLYESINQRVKDLLENGYKITGKVKIGNCDLYRYGKKVSGWKYVISDSNQQYKSIKEKEYYVFETVNLRVKKFLPEVKPTISLVELYLWKVNYKLNQGFLNSAKLLYSSVRKLLNDQVLSALFKYKVSKYYYSPFALSLNDYMSFSAKIKLTGDCGSLLPLLNLYEGKRVIKIDGTNKSFLYVLSQYGFTKGDISILRKTRPSTVSTFAAIVANDIAYKNPLMQIIRSKYINNFPAEVIHKLFEAIKSGFFWVENEIDAEKGMLITTRWLEYHQRVWKERGYKKSPQIWHDIHSGWIHAIDWCKLANPNIHKNQYWSSIFNLSNEWFNAYYNDNYGIVSDETPLPDSWEGLYDAEIDCGCYLVEQITEAARLRAEGEEMHHCVYFYGRSCASGHYAVFSVKDDVRQERGTLGVNIGEGIITFDQLQGEGNSYTSRTMVEFVKKYINHLNVLRL